MKFLVIVWFWTQVHNLNNDKLHDLYHNTALQNTWSSEIKLPKLILWHLFKTFWFLSNTIWYVHNILYPIYRWDVCVQICDVRTAILFLSIKLCTSWNLPWYVTLPFSMLLYSQKFLRHEKFLKSIKLDFHINLFVRQFQIFMNLSIVIKYYDYWYYNQ